MGNGQWAMGIKRSDRVFHLPHAPCPMPHDGRCVTVGRAFPTHCLPHAPCPMPHDGRCVTVGRAFPTHCLPHAPCPMPHAQCPIPGT
ncbi:MAG: hypothetical protein KME31_35775 [Tolypothrix carrinoi HA7290-LM1]|nr:hypothetical protein [Tolypothrix carrinoi HA7290-LM1]